MRILHWKELDEFPELSTGQETNLKNRQDPRGTRPAISRSQGHLLGILMPLATHGHITGCHGALAPRSHGKRGEWVSNSGHQAQSLHSSPTQGANQRTRSIRHTCERGIPDGRRGFQHYGSDPWQDVHCRPQPSRLHTPHRNSKQYLLCDHMSNSLFISLLPFLLFFVSSTSLHPMLSCPMYSFLFLICIIYL